VVLTTLNLQRTDDVEKEMHWEKNEVVPQYAPHMEQNNIIYGK